MSNPKSKYYQIPNNFQIPNPKFLLGFRNWDLFGSIGSIGNWDLTSFLFNFPKKATPVAGVTCYPCLTHL